MADLRDVDLTGESVGDARREGRIRTQWKELSDNSKQHSDEDESKADGFNLLDGADVREEYALDAQGVSDDVRAEMEIAEQRGAGHEDDVKAPEADEWHEGLEASNAAYRPEQVAMVNEQAAARRTQRSGMAERIRDEVAMDATLTGLAKMAAATKAINDNGIVADAKERLVGNTTREQRLEVVERARDSIEAAQAEEELEK